MQATAKLVHKIKLKWCTLLEYIWAFLIPWQQKPVSRWYTYNFCRIS